MMEIKFRAWDKKDRIMYPEVVGIDFYNGVINLSSNYNCKIVMRDCILLQFIGLYDKSGKEIYRGILLNWKVEECVKYIGFLQFQMFVGI